MITGMNIQAGGKIAPAFMLTRDGTDVSPNFSNRLIGLTMQQL